MGILVQKFGGTSVGSVERIQNTANRVIEAKEEGNDIVVVVSAMGKTTDQLVTLAKGLTSFPSKREMDMLLSTGEQVTISLLAMALKEKGYDAVSYTGWQAGVITEDVHSNARILDIRTDKIQSQLNQNKIVIVAGFQGMTEDGEITTLGRGGSDTTAVALAAALKAEKCKILTDVTGVYTSDPRYVKNARKLDAISYDEMLELANLGAGVLHPRAVEFAKNDNITLEVCSSLEKEPGTVIEEEVAMENQLVVRGVAFEDDITRVTIFGLKKGLKDLAIFSILAKQQINVDIIIQNQTEDAHSYLSFTVKNEDLHQLESILTAQKDEIDYAYYEVESELAKVSIIGSGMISNPGVAATMFETLANNDIQVKMVSTSEIKVSAVVSVNHMLAAAQKLHAVFGLDAVAQEVK